MYLSNIKLWNFRKFGIQLADSNKLDLQNPDLDLNFTKGLNVLVGENDSGKSAIIDAIKLVLKTHSIEWITPHEDDFYNKSFRFRIELRFDDFTDDEAKYFTEWLSWEGEGEDAKVFLRVIYDVSRITERILPTDVRAGIDETGYPLTAEAKEQLRATYLRPLRDAANELIPRKDSRLSKIFYGHEAFRGREKDHSLIKELDDFSSKIETYFENDESGRILRNTIAGYIKDFCDDSKEIELKSFGRGDLRGILEKLQLSMLNEMNLGLGTQNRLFMASELLHLNKESWDGIRLGLIEELEAHLHPQAQMKVVEALQSQKNVQLILTTHSPNLASKVKLENLILCHNKIAFPMGGNYTELAEDDYKFLEKFLDVTKSNLFFAQGLIFVEGWAEEILIPSIAKKIGYDLTKNGVSVVNVGSLAFRRYSKVFLRKNLPEMEIPVSIITDSDITAYEKDEEDYIKKDEEEVSIETSKKNLQLQKDFTKQKVNTFVAPCWTLEYSILNSNSCLSNLLIDVLNAIHTGTDWETNPEESLAIKLLNKGLKKTEIAYQLAKEIDELDSLEIEDNDSIAYLLEAIKYACRN